MRRKVVSILALLCLTISGAMAQTITLSSVSNGTVVAKVNDSPVTSAAAGVTVTLVATPDAGYRLKTISGTQDLSEILNINTGSYGDTFLNGTNVSASGNRNVNGCRVGSNYTLTISSRSEQNLSKVVLTVGKTGNAQRDISHLHVDHGFLTVTGTSENSTVTITGIDSPSVTVSAPDANTNAKLWTFTQATVDVLLGNVALTGTSDDNVKTFIMPSSNVTFSAEFEEAPALTLTDGEILSALSAYAGQTCTVNYTRSFTNGKPSTVCLPFAYTPKPGETFYTFSGIEKVGGEYIATMTESAATTLTANTPYLYMPSAGSVDFSGTYVIPNDLTAGTTTPDGNDWTFKGTYETIEWTTAPATPTYGFSAQGANDGITQGQFVKVGEYVRIKPMRAYLEYNGSDSEFAGTRALAPRRAAEELPETITVRLVSATGEVNAIATLNTRTGEVSQDGWYTLDGKHLNAQPTQKGIYVNNGKKVIIK